MKQKNVSIILLLVFTLLCAISYISYNYYSKTIGVFKNNSPKLEVELVSLNDSSFLELKKSISEKYFKKLTSELAVFSEDYKKGITEILGEDYLKKANELDNVKEEIHNKKTAFLNSNEYLSKKKELLDLKEKMDKASDEEYNNLYETFQKALSEISTLNVKLNNSLKGLKEKQTSIKEELTKLFDKNKDKLTVYRDAQKKKISEVILTIINEYNFELSELHDAFSLPQNKMREIPFDVDKFSFKSVTSSFESDYFNETIVESSTEDTKIEFVDVSFNEVN